MNFCPHYNTMNFYSVEERQNMLRVVITRPGTGPEFSFRTRYPARPEICLLVPPLLGVAFPSVDFIRCRLVKKSWLIDD